MSEQAEAILLPSFLKTTPFFTHSNSGGNGSSGSCRRRSSGGWRTCKFCGGRRRGGRRSGSRYSAPSAHRTHPFRPGLPARSCCLAPCSPIPFPPSFPTPRFPLSFPASLFLSVFSHPSTPTLAPCPPVSVPSFPISFPTPASFPLHLPSWVLYPRFLFIPCPLWGSSHPCPLYCSSLLSSSSSPH